MCSLLIIAGLYFRIPLGGGIQSREVRVKLGGVFIYLLVSNSGNDY